MVRAAVACLLRPHGGGPQEPSLAVAGADDEGGGDGDDGDSGGGDWADE